MARNSNICELHIPSLKRQRGKLIQRHWPKKEKYLPNELYNKILNSEEPEFYGIYLICYLLQPSVYNIHILHINQFILIKLYRILQPFEILFTLCIVQNSLDEHSSFSTQVEFVQYKIIVNDIFYNIQPENFVYVYFRQYCQQLIRHLHPGQWPRIL